MNWLCAKIETTTAFGKSFACHMVIPNRMNNMNKVIKRVTLVLTVGVAVASSIAVTNATVVDLGERHLGTRLNGRQAAIAFIEADQSLNYSLTYLNSFDVDDGDWDNAQGAVDSSYFGVTMIDGDVHANISWDLSTTGYQLSYVLLKDGNYGPGDFLYHLYGVTPDEVFNSKGDQFVTVDNHGVRLITYMSFFGVPGNPVPDGGTTLVFLGVGLGAIGLIRKTLLHSPA
jgi:hypothetical protein